MIDPNRSVDFASAAEVFLGSLPTLIVLGGWLWRIDGKLKKYLVEHEILILDYCKRESISPAQLPTRTKL